MYSKYSNILQLVVGMLSIMIFIIITVVQIRFFPIQASINSTISKGFCFSGAWLCASQIHP